MYTYEFTRQAAKQLKKLPSGLQKRIIQKLDYFISSSQPLSFASFISNDDLGCYRFCIGDYRVIFDLEDETLVILSIGHRREIYK